MSRATSVFWSGAGFLSMLGVHAGWNALWPSSNAEQDRWVAVPTAAPSWHQAYISSGDIWLGLSIASAGAFAAWAIHRWWLRRTRVGAVTAIGGMTWTGLLAGAGCFLTGCCGSPMLAVWLSLLGATALPWIKPVSFVVSLIAIGFGAWWVLRRERQVAAFLPCGDRGCGCDTPRQPRPA